MASGQWTLPELGTVHLRVRRGNDVDRLMAFWTAGGKLASCSDSVTPAVSGVKPVSVLLHASGDFSTFVRLRVKVPATAAAVSLADTDADGEGCEAAAHAAAAAVGRLHQLMLGLEQKSADARKHSVTQIVSPELLQMLCQKAVVAKLYKSLMPHQSALGYQLGDVKSCISLTPLGLWELHEVLHTAVVKTLTGNSSGVSSSTGGSWMSLNGSKLLKSNILAAEPGVLQHASFVEFEVKAQPPSKVLMLIKAAGTVKFRLFCPMQALCSDSKAIRLPLTTSDTTESLLADPAKLAAAARQLDGRAVKLLPDERLAFIKTLRAAPTDPNTLQHLSSYWLGHYGLRLPEHFPFMLGVASHPEAESASLEVPSCCVMTNLRLSVLPGSQPGGSCYNEVVGLLLEELRTSEVQLMGGEGFKVESSSGTSATTDAQLQLSQAATQSATPASSSQATCQPKLFSISASWTTASDLSKLQAAATAEAAAAASKQGGQQQKKAAGKPPVALATTTAAAAQLMGLQELQDLEAFVAAAAGDRSSLPDAATAAVTAAGVQLKPELRIQRAKPKPDPTRWAKLNDFLQERVKQDQELRTASLQAAGIAVASSSSKSSSSAAAAKPPAGPSRSAAGAAARGVPSLPTFKSRKPGIAAAVAAKAASKAAVPLARPARATADVDDEDFVCPPKAAATGPPVAPAVPQMPVLKKTPALAVKRPAPAAAKPPAAKKAKAAATAASADRNSVVSKPKAPKKAAAAAAAAGPSAEAGRTNALAPAPDTAAAAAALAEAAACGAAAAAAPKRAKTKASDLDVAAVSAKIQAAYAAGGGSSLKGLSVPEMQCYLRANGQKGGPTKKAEVEARLLAFLASRNGVA